MQNHNYTIHFPSFSDKIRKTEKMEETDEFQPTSNDDETEPQDEQQQQQQDVPENLNEAPEKPPRYCKVPGCNKDLTDQNPVNAERHEKYCLGKHQKSKSESTKKEKNKKKYSVFMKSYFGSPTLAKKPKQNISSTSSSTESSQADTSSQGSSSDVDFTFHDQVQGGSNDSVDNETMSVDSVDAVVEMDNELSGVDSVADVSQAVDGDVEIIGEKRYCEGYVPPSISGNVYELFPFQLLPSLEFVVFASESFHHAECKKINFVLSSDVSGNSNILCRELGQNKQFSAIVDRSTSSFQDLQTYNNKFLNFQQLSSKSTFYYNEFRRSRLDIMKLNGKICRLGKSLDMHDRFLTCVSQNSIPGLKQLVCVALRNNRSINYIVEKVVSAINGVYRARPSDDDKDLALLILEFGGPSLLDICYRDNVLPGVSTAYRMRQKTKNIVSNIGTTVKQCLKSNTDLSPENSTWAVSIKADETHVTARPRYDAKQDCIQGLCSSHGARYMKLNNYDDATKLLKAVEEGAVHVPHEVTVVGCTSMNDLSPTEVVCAWPTCDKGDYIESLKLFESLAEEFKAATGKDPMNFGTDGDATRRQVFNALLSHELDPESSIGQILSGIPLLDLLCGVHKETVSFDPKHLAKRCWTAFVRESVCLQGATVKKSDLKELFSLLPDSNPLKLDGIFFPKDKQNVPAATTFLLAFIDSVRNIPEKDFPFRLVPIRKQLLLLANVYEGLISFYVYTDLDIEKQIVRFSVAAHSLFYLSRCEPVKVIPNQLYHDLQTTFIDAIFCCAKAQVYFPDKPLFLVLNGTDSLERIFGILRLKVKNASMDYLTLLHCIGSMLRCDEILTTKHPDWSKKSRNSRRLCLDYSNPRSWDAEKLCLRNVDIRSLWESGHLKVRAQVLEHALIKSDVTVESLTALKCSLKKPRAKLIGVHEVEKDSSIDDEEPCTDEEATSEEATADEPDEPDEDVPPLADMIETSSTIDVDGKNIYKASVIKALFASNTLSKDRLKRVQGLTAGTPGASSVSSDDNMVFVGDPMVVHNGEKTQIAAIQKIRLGNVAKKNISCEEMEKPNLQFELKALNLKEGADSNKMFWDGTFTSTSSIKVMSNKCVLIKPAVCPNPPVGMSNYYFDKQCLLDIGVQFTLSSVANPPLKEKKQRNACKICNVKILCDRMRGHIGYHILSKKDLDSHVCGFCGLQSCSNKFKQSSAVVQSTCSYFYSYGRKPQYSRRERCSNRLERCRASGCSAVLWSYHMSSHYEQCHSALEVPKDFIVCAEEVKTITSFKA